MFRRIAFFLSIMIVLLCLSFQIKVEKKDIQFVIEPRFDKEDLVLNKAKYITLKKDTISITTLKFYISNVVLEYENGTEYKEPKSVHLIDIEELNTLQFQLKKTPDLKIKKIQFNIGIDSLTTVSGNLDGDLDPSLGMYWAWNTGYINMKLEGKSNSCKTLKKDFQFHIGGYLPNQNALQEVSLMVPDNATTLHLKMDLSKWLNEISLNETNSIMIPGAKAIAMSELYKNMFQITQ
jgi:hypothetical protein